MPLHFLHSFMNQRWEDLLLLHWPVDGEKVKNTLPDDLNVDLHEGQAWLSVVGFKLTGLRISPFRWIPWSGFWEINLRTYVKDRNGNKGIWFYSLDSSDLFAVMGARMLYGLEYNYAITEGTLDDKQISFFSSRKFPHPKANARFSGVFQSNGKKEGSFRSDLDVFLLERYLFWARRKFFQNSAYAGVRHIPYEAVTIDKPEYEGELFKSQGFNEPSAKPLLGHYCKGFDVQATAPSWAFSIAGHANHKKEEFSIL